MRRIKRREQWKMILKYPSYAISTLGRIKRIKSYQGYRAGRILSTKYINGRGYKIATLWKDNKKYILPIHVLVLSTFRKRPGSKYSGHHRNEDKLRNYLSNLIWIEHGKHTTHHCKGKERLDIKGRKNPAVKLTILQVRKIKKMLFNNISISIISKTTGINRSNIKNIKYGYTWKHINYP